MTRLLSVSKLFVYCNIQLIKQSCQQLTGSMKSLENKPGNLCKGLNNCQITQDDLFYLAICLQNASTFSTLPQGHPRSPPL